MPINHVRTVGLACQSENREKSFGIRVSYGFRSSVFGFFSCRSLKPEVWVRLPARHSCFVVLFLDTAENEFQHANPPDATQTRPGDRALRGGSRRGGGFLQIGATPRTFRQGIRASLVLQTPRSHVVDLQSRPNDCRIGGGAAWRTRSWSCGVR